MENELLFTSPNDFSFYIEKFAKLNKLTYFDALIKYCTDNFIEFSEIASMVNVSLKDKIRKDAIQENYFPNESSLLDIMK